MQRTVLFLAFTVVLSWVLPHAAAEESWETTTQQILEVVPPGKRVLVSNKHGNLHARFGGYGNKVEFVATVQDLKGDGSHLEIVPRRTEEVLDVAVVAVAETRPGAPADAPAVEPGRDRVDLVVFVPKGIALDARTEAGAIEVKGVQGDVSAESVKGPIRLWKIQGRVGARSERGSIAARLETGVTQEPQEFTTRTGDISIEVWEDANLTAKMATSGSIAADFSTTLERRRLEEPSKHVVAVVGAGGPELGLQSKRGDLLLRWIPRSSPPEDDAEPSGTDAPEGAPAAGKRPPRSP